MLGQLAGMTGELHRTFVPVGSVPIEKIREFNDGSVGNPAELTLRENTERRRFKRHHPDELAALKQAAKPPVTEPAFLLPRQAGAMAAFLSAAYVIAAGVAQALPSNTTAFAAIGSVALFACGSLFSAAERNARSSQRLRLMMVFLAIVLPMACAGFALASWVAEGLPWQWAIATLVCLNAAAAAFFEIRIISLFCAKIASWTGFAVIAPGAITVAALAGVAIAFALIARLEWNAAERRRTARDARERIAARAEDILRSFEETGQGWFWETDRRGLITYISPKAAVALGKPLDAVCGCPLTEIVDAHAGVCDAERTLMFHLAARSAFLDVEARAATNGEERWWALSGRPVYDSYSNFCGFRGHGTDLTEKHRTEQQVSRLAHFDSLTGLANRTQMGNALEQILAAPRACERECAVLMLDLDRFKQVNDTFGHPVGDALLKQVAQRLERSIDGVGRCGRLGGDEFQVIVPGQQDRAKLGHIARKVVAALAQPYLIDGQSVIIGASVGIALAPEHGSTSKELIRNVDLALYAAKDAGRGRFLFYAEHLHAAAEEQAELEHDLRDAIARNGLDLYYQPIVLAATEKIVGFEALMRWKHPKRGWLSPAKFVPIAEDAGLIDRLSRWVLNTACADLARWPQSIHCAVNISALQFANPDLPTIVANALAHSDVAASRLELEITESVFAGNSSGSDAMFMALKRIGVRLALDDFGTSSSALFYLKEAPFDKIKIDRSFVQGATALGSRNGAIIASITSLAEALEMETTAEGVETLDELELVRLHGCSHVQGFIYSKPLNADDATALVSGDLSIIADGPQSVRAARQNLLRRVVVSHDGKCRNATLRNVSESGAMIVGLWNIVPGNAVRIEFSSDQFVTAQVRWSRENRTGVEFDMPLPQRADGSFTVLKPTPANTTGMVVR